MSIREALQRLKELLSSGMYDVLKESDRDNDERDLEALQTIVDYLDKQLR